MLTRTKKNTGDPVDGMIKAIDGLLDDILKHCVEISKEWGDENIIALATIDQALNIASGNTAKMKGKNIVDLRTNILLLIGGLKSYCHEKALEMDRKSLPKKVLVFYIREIKNKVRIGANKPELPPVFDSK